MIRFRSARPHLLLLGAALAGCSDGGSDAGTAVLRAKVEAQAAEIDALKKAARDMDARARGIEERLSAVAVTGASSPAAAAKPPAAEEEGAPEAGAAEVPTTEAVAAFLDTEQGRQKLAEAMETAEKRRAEKADQEQRERMQGLVKERVTGYLTEQLNLDSAQQQTVLTVALETTEKMGEVWRGMRESRGDPAALAQVREKTNEIRQQAVDRIQQALTVDQFNKFQEILNDGGGGFLMGGGRGAMGAGPPGGGGGRGGR